MIIQTGGILMTHQLFSAIDKIFHSHPQRGAILVLFAITFPFLMAFSAIAVDLGTVYVQRVHMQNAADAGALAGAGEIANDTAKNNIASTAQTFVSNNNEPGNDAQVSAVTSTGSSTDVTVTLTKDVPLYFFRYFGFDSIPVTVTATARYTPGSSGMTFNGIFDYALASGSTDNNSINVNTNNSFFIDGNIMTNGKISLIHHYSVNLSGYVSANPYNLPVWSHRDWYNGVEMNFPMGNSDGTSDASVQVRPSSNADISISQDSNPEIKNYIDNTINYASKMSASDRINNHVYYGSTGSFYTDNNGNGTLLSDNGSSYTGLTDGTNTNPNKWAPNPYSTIVTDASWVSVIIDVNHPPTDTTVLIATKGNISTTINAVTPGKTLILIAEEGDIDLQVYKDAQIIAYAPKGKITIDPYSSAGKIYGSLVAQTFSITTPQTIIHQTITAPGNSSVSAKGSVRLIQ
jgi:Flp pilus assembly protein TadG